MCIIEISYLRQREFRRKETHEKKSNNNRHKANIFDNGNLKLLKRTRLQAREQNVFVLQIWLIGM